ncbi:MAG TPA: hypothetical protein VFT74_01655, partial [Isosphaeraceae bacterium]|nr:hypothetical protein [Isosphaeraceae bacterium]
MFRWVTRLCLLVVLASPLLAQAKMACGLSHSLSEFGGHYFESTEEEQDEAYDGLELVALSAETRTASPDNSPAPGGLSLATSRFRAHFAFAASFPARFPRRPQPVSAPERRAWVQS